MIAAVYRDAHRRCGICPAGLEDKDGAGHAQWRGISAEVRFAAGGGAPPARARWRDADVDLVDVARCEFEHV